MIIVTLIFTGFFTNSCEKFLELQEDSDVIAGKPKDEWEIYDIIFRSARFDKSEPEEKIENPKDRYSIQIFVSMILD